MNFEDKIEMTKKDLIWYIVLYGAVMWAAGFAWATVV